MAEHLNQSKPDHSGDPFHWMGKPLPPSVRDAGYWHCRAMGLDHVKAHACTEQVPNALERDEPYQAQAAAMRYPDLTGYYRIVAVLLAARCLVDTQVRDTLGCDPCDDWGAFVGPQDDEGDGLCADCGLNPADLGAHLCVGCKAYKEHSQ